MEIFNLILGVPLGHLIYIAFQITNSYGPAILLFAVFARVVLFPVSVIAHKNSIRLLQIQPSLSAIKRRYSADKESLNEAQYELFKREKYSPFLGIIPLILQLLLMIGMLQVLYHPLQHVLRLDQSIIETLVRAAGEIESISGSGQMRVLAAFSHPEYISVFQAALFEFPQADQIINQITNMDLRFLGFSLGTTPSMFNPSIELLIPLFSGISALVFCMVQSTLNPGALGQSRRANNGLTIFTVALSLYFAYILPVEVGIYWTAGNLAATGVVIVLDIIYPPKKLAGEALVYIKANRKTSSQLREERLVKKELKIREKADVAKFKAADKKLVLYALTGGQYKFYKNIIEYILANSDVTIHYLTNDPEDSLFKNEQADMSRLIPYYASQQKTISLMLKLETDIMVTTVPDLQVYHMKRSIVRDDIEYIYIHHGLGSTHLAAREAAYDHFDTVLCVGPHQAAELRRREELAGVPRKNLVKAGYGLYDQLVESYAKLPPTQEDKPKILIAPSWQADNIFDICINEILDELLGNDFIIYVRPHPQFLQVFPERIDSLKKHYEKFVDNNELIFDLNLLDNNTIFSSDLLITDWSNIAFEFSFCMLKPSIFINTPMKILNPDYEQFEIEALEISLRDKVGVSVDVENIHKIKEIITKTLGEKELYKECIEDVVKQYLFYPGRSGEAGGAYIINRLKAK